MLPKMFNENAWESCWQELMKEPLSLCRFESLLAALAHCKTKQPSLTTIRGSIWGVSAVHLHSQHTTWVCVHVRVCVCAQTHECTPMGMGCHAECASRDQTRQGQWLHLWVNNTRVAVWMADGSLASSTRKFIGESPSSWFLINFNVFFCCLNLPVASWG